MNNFTAESIRRLQKNELDILSLKFQESLKSHVLTSKLNYFFMGVSVDTSEALKEHIESLGFEVSYSYRTNGVYTELRVSW